MNNANGILRTLFDDKGLLDDALPGRLLVEICNKKRVLIEHHCGIIEYGCDEILVKTKDGCVRVSGSQLKLAKMGKR